MLHTKSRVQHVDLAFEDLSHVEGEFKSLVWQFYGKGITLTKSDNGHKAIKELGQLTLLKKHYCLLN